MNFAEIKVKIRLWSQIQFHKDIADLEVKFSCDGGNDMAAGSQCNGRLL